MDYFIYINVENQIMYATHGTQGLFCISVHVGAMASNIAATWPADFNCASVNY